MKNSLNHCQEKGAKMASLTHAGQVQLLSISLVFLSFPLELTCICTQIMRQGPFKQFRHLLQLKLHTLLKAKGDICTQAKAGWSKFEESLRTYCVPVYAFWWVLPLLYFTNRFWCWNYQSRPLIYSGFGNECWSKQVTQRNNLKYNQIYVRLKGILHRKGNEKSGKQVL